MQVNDEYIDELFARKLGNTEVTPPHDGWLRIENELNRRSRMMRKFWLTAASFALVLSVTATVVYVQTHTTTEQGTVLAVRKNTLQQQSSAGDQDRNIAEQQETPRNTAPENRNDIPQSEGTAITTATTAFRNEDNALANVTPTTDMQAIPTDKVAVSDVSEDASVLSSTPVYIDSWDEMHRMQPIKTNRLGILSNKYKLAQLQPEKPVQKAEPTIAVATPDMPVYDEIARVDIADMSTDFRPRNRLEITGQFAPMYSYRVISSVPKGVRKSDFDDAESPLLSYSGGVTVVYKFFERLSVQTGLFYSQMGQSINSVTPVANMYAAVSSNNSYPKNFVRTSSGNVTVTSNLKSEVNTTYASYFNTESQTATTNTIPMANSSSPAKYRLIERIDYLEIPLVLHYKIIDRKLNIYVLGGMSTNVLINNNVFVDNGSELVKSGAVLMARPVNYSGTLGLELGYQLTGNLSVGFEPSLKYYLKSYTTSNHIGSNPYAFGLFTSFHYRF